MAAQLFEAHETCFAQQLDVDVQPAWRIRRRAGVEVLTVAIELGCIGIGELGYGDDARDAGLRAARVLKECLIAELHIVAHEVARLIITHTPPCRGLSLCLGEIIDAEYIRLRFHEPVALRLHVTALRFAHCMPRTVIRSHKNEERLSRSPGVRAPRKCRSGRHLEPEVQGGRFPSASGASISETHNSTTLGRNRVYHIGSKNLQPEQTPQGATLESLCQRTLGSTSAARNLRRSR